MLLAVALFFLLTNLLRARRDLRAALWALAAGGGAAAPSPWRSTPSARGPSASWSGSPSSATRPAG